MARPEFRALEQRVILRVLENGPQVLSTGGGAFMNAQTREAIAGHGVSVWLKAEIDMLMERVSKKQNRPLLKNADPRAVLEQLMAERYPVYAAGRCHRADPRRAQGGHRGRGDRGALPASSAMPRRRDRRGAVMSAMQRHRRGRAWRPRLRHPDRRRPARARRRGDFARGCRASRAAIVTDDNVAAAHLEPLKASLETERHRSRRSSRCRRAKRPRALRICRRWSTACWRRGWSAAMRSSRSAAASSAILPALPPASCGAA